MNLMRVSAIVAGLIFFLVTALAIFSCTVTLPFTVETKGRIEPKKILPIATTVSGYIKYIVKPGEIKKGDILLELDCSKLVEEKEKAESMIAFLEKEKEKEKPPLGDYRRRYSITKELKELDNKLSSLKLDIEQHTIKCPFDGMVMAVNSEKGELLKSGENALMVADISGYIFTGNVGQEALKELSIGQKTSIRLDSYSYMKYGEIDAKLSLIDSQLSKDGSSNHKVSCSIQSKPEFKLLSGLTGTGRIVVFEGTILNYLLNN